MPNLRPHSAIDDLRARIARIERSARHQAGVLPFGQPSLDAVLPDGGLLLGALHEVVSAGSSAGDGSASVLFTAGIAARSAGKTLWCLARPDLFAPGLAQAGLDADRVIYVEADDERAMLGCFEEGLRHGGLGAVVAEVNRLSMTASRRLQLAAESSGTLGIALRRWHRAAGPVDVSTPSAAVTRWRISVLPSTGLLVPGIGRARWRVELLRCRGGGSGAWEMEACDAEGRLAVPAELANRPATQKPGVRRATG